MEYKIISADAVIGQINVTYLDRGTSIATYAIDVPIIDGMYIAGAALDAEIRSRAPLWLLERKEEAATSAGFDSILSMVNHRVANGSVAPTLEQYKLSKSAAINIYREKVLASGIQYNGNTYASDSSSISRLTTLASIMSLESSSFKTVIWRTKANTEVELSLEAISTLLNSMVEKTNEIFAKSWLYKANIEAATSEAELSTITWSEFGVPDKVTGLYAIIEDKSKVY